MTSHRRRAFTLVELLVVISIIAMLMSILLPALGRSRENAKRVVCMSNLRSIGQFLFIYANDNDEQLVPGDTWQAWDAWGRISDSAFSCSDSNNYQGVNLGHLIISKYLEIPASKKHVFFCPSLKNPNGDEVCQNLKDAWGQQAYGPIGYMFNNALCGFDDFVQSGVKSIMPHQDKINFLRGDGSVDVFKIRPEVYDVEVGPELLQEVCLRYGVCFPTIMLHEWFVKGNVDVDEAKEFLANPQTWMEDNQTFGKTPVLLSNVSNKSLACDVVGVWGGDPPTLPGST